MQFSVALLAVIILPHPLAVFTLEDALFVWTNLGKHSLFLWLFVSSVKTGTTRIIRLDELSSVVRRSLYYKAAILIRFSARSTKILLLLQIKVAQFSSFSKQ